MPPYSQHSPYIGSHIGILGPFSGILVNIEDPHGPVDGARPSHGRWWGYARDPAAEMKFQNRSDFSLLLLSVSLVLFPLASRRYLAFVVILQYQILIG